MRCPFATYFVATAFDARPSQSETADRATIGRKTACSGFLGALFGRSEWTEFAAYCRDETHFSEFVRQLETRRCDASAEWVPRGQTGPLKQFGCLFRGDPVLAPIAWERSASSASDYSLCGVTHTLSTAAAMDAVGSYLTAPVEEWDALVCTSPAARSVVDGVLERWSDWLGQRWGTRPIARIQRPVIPLGVDTSDWAERRGTVDERAAARASIGVDEATVVFLYAGRLSFHNKAHPWPLFVGLEAAARRTGRSLQLRLVGQFANRTIEQEIRRAAQTECPSVDVQFENGGDDASWLRCWRSADVFVSLADSVQETFGLTPVEAMAAGLPSVVTDWNGYRSTVRHGVDGFCVPTWQPAPGSGDSIAQRFGVDLDSYDRYLGHASQCTVVDIAACVDAFCTLIDQPEQRRQMGSAARARAESVFDWNTVAGQYGELAVELASIRATHQSGPGPVNPLRDDPFTIFETYSTGRVDESASVAMASETPREDLDRLLKDRLANYVGQPFLLATPSTCQEVLAQISPESAPVGQLLQCVSDDKRKVTLRTIAWMAKVGLIRVSTPSAMPDHRATCEPDGEPS